MTSTSSAENCLEPGACGPMCGTRAAIKVITMILISIQPFAPKKLFAVVATIACLSTASCFADAMYLSAKSEVSNRKIQRAQADSVTAIKADRLLLVPSDDIQDLRGAV